MKQIIIIFVGLKFKLLVCVCKFIKYSPVFECKFTLLLVQYHCIERKKHMNQVKICNIYLPCCLKGRWKRIDETNSSSVLESVHSWQTLRYWNLCRDECTASSSLARIQTRWNADDLQLWESQRIAHLSHCFQCGCFYDYYYYYSICWQKWLTMHE